MLQKIKRPVLFQGNLKKEHYFEGWYYKQVTADQKTSLSFIPAVSLNPNDEHAFIQYILVQIDDYEEVTTQTGYLRFSVKDFLYQHNPFKVSIGESSFSENHVHIDMMDEPFRFRGDIQFGPLHPIETNALQPNIMGVFGYIPKMECYHGVISMKHDLSGFMWINNEKIDFSGGRGYIEKDWGTSFPKQYIWLHSNHFEKEETSLFFSVAHIPFHFTEFEGFIANLVVENKEYRFATYNLSQCRILHVAQDAVRIVLENDRATLDIYAEVLDQGQLIAPVQGTMQKAIKEGISGKIHIKLSDKTTGKVYEDVGQNAGVEIVDYTE